MGLIGFFLCVLFIVISNQHQSLFIIFLHDGNISHSVYLPVKMLRRPRCGYYKVHQIHHLGTGCCKNSKINCNLTSYSAFSSAFSLSHSEFGLVLGFLAGLAFFGGLPLLFTGLFGVTVAFFFEASFCKTANFK